MAGRGYWLPCLLGKVARLVLCGGRGSTSWLSTGMQSTNYHPANLSCMSCLFCRFADCPHEHRWTVSLSASDDRASKENSRQLYMLCENQVVPQPASTPCRNHHPYLNIKDGKEDNQKHRIANEDQNKHHWGRVMSLRIESTCEKRLDNLHLQLFPLSAKMTGDPLLCADKCLANVSFLPL